MALTDEQKKNMLIGGGVGALTLAIGWLLGRRKAEVATGPQSARFAQPPGHLPSAMPMYGMQGVARKPIKRRRDGDNNERGERGERGDNERGDNDRGEYRKKRRRRGD